MKSGVFLSVVFVLFMAQTPSDVKSFNASELSFSYPNGWTLHDDTNSDAQQLTLARANNDIQIRVFAHKGRMTIFGPDREIKQFTPAWDMVRTTLQVEDKSTPKPSPKP
jgi:hypothetical protein